MKQMTLQVFKYIYGDWVYNLRKMSKINAPFVIEHIAAFLTFPS